MHDCIGILEWLYQSILNHFDEKLFSTHLGWIVAPYLFFTDLFWMHTSSTSATCRKKLRSHCSKLLAKIRSVNRQAFLSLIERRCMFLLGISADDICQSYPAILELWCCLLNECLSLLFSYPRSCFSFLHVHFQIGGQHGILGAADFEWFHSAWHLSAGTAVLSRPSVRFFSSNHRGIRNNPHGGEVVYRKIIRGGWLLRLFFCGVVMGGQFYWFWRVVVICGIFGVVSLVGVKSR